MGQLVWFLSTSSDLKTWTPAVVGILGALVTYVIGWRKDKDRQQRFATKDAVETLTALLTAANVEIAAHKTAELECNAHLLELKLELNAMKIKATEDRDEIFRLQMKVYELDQHLPKAKGEQRGQI